MTPSNRPAITTVLRHVARAFLFVASLCISLAPAPSLAYDAVGSATCCDRGTYMVLPVINFASDSSELSPVEVQKLARLVQVLEEYPGLQLWVFGHTDSRGSVAYNRRLSARRAEAVVAHLRSKGVDAARLTTKAMSEGRPMATNADQPGRADNRRVVFAER